MADIVQKIDKLIAFVAQSEKKENEKGFKQVISPHGFVLGMGNPLLDISSPVGDAFMKKYGIRPSNAILAEAKHFPMYKELSALSSVSYIGGGSTLNSIRVCQWMRQKKGSTGYFGCIGNDKFGETLAKCASADAVDCHFLTDEKVATGTCAVCVTDKERSLVANLSAANEFKASHLSTAKAKAMIAKSKVIYSAGFFLTVSPESMAIAAEHCKTERVPFCVNFSAEFIVSVPIFAGRLTKLLPLVSHIFSNEDEATAFAKANKMQFKSMKELALLIADLPYERKDGQRTVVITQGKEPVIVAHKGKATEFPIALLSKDKIVDVNGAGDGFVGGFLSQLVDGKDIKTCVSAGNYAARYIIQTEGTKLVGKPTFVTGGSK